MRKRDKAIISDLERFGAITRDQLIALHFQGLRNPISNANAVMLRLYRQDRIERNADFSQYVYFPKRGGAGRNSQKLQHYLAIVDTYIEMRRLGVVDGFIVEPKYSKGLAEPDLFAIWKGSPFFIEVQLSRINQREITNKIKRYEALVDSGIIDDEPWQPQGKALFPTVIFISDTRYAIESKAVKFVQVRELSELIPKRQPVKPIKTEPASDGIRITLT